MSAHGKHAAKSRGLLLAACLAGVALVGWMDYASGEEVSVSLLYLAPVSAAAWWAGLPGGLFIAAASGLAWALGARAESFFSGRILLANDLLELVTFVLVAYLVDRVARALRREHLLAHTDTLTGLSNRRDFYLELEAARARLRKDGRPFQVLYLDLDGFKGVNDRQGHVAGDKVLTDVAAVLLEAQGPGETAARLGGDEFAFLCPASDARSGDILAALDQRLKLGGSGVTVSAGELTCSDPSIDVDRIIHLSDQLMYKVKKAGKHGLRRGQAGRAAVRTAR